MATIGALVYKLGLDVSELTENVKTANSKLDGLATGAKTVGKVLAGAFAVSSIASAVTAFTDLAGSLTDLSAKTGIGVEALQKYKFAAEQTGTTLDAMTSAVFKLQANLGKGGNDIAAVLKGMGLSLQELQRLSPEDQFAAVADSLGKVTNQSDFARAGIALFGKGFGEIAPTLRQGFSELADQAARFGLVLDEQTIAAGDEFGDMMDVLKAQGIALIAQVLKPLLPMLTALAQGFAQVAAVIGQVLGKALEWVMWAFLQAGKYIDLFLAGVADAATKIPLLGKHLGFAAGAAEWFRNDAAKADEALAKLGQSSATTGPKIGGLTPPLLGAGHAAKKTKTDLEQLAESVQKFATQLDAATKGGRATLYLAEFGKEIENVVAKSRALGVAVPEALAKAADLSFITRTLAQAGEDISQLARKIWDDVAKAAEEAGKRTNAAWAKAMTALGSLTSSVLGRTTSVLDQELAQVADWARETTDALRAAGIEDQAIFDAIAAEASQRMAQIRQDHADMTQEMADDVERYGATFRDVVSQIPLIFQAAFRDGGGGWAQALKTIFINLGTVLLNDAKGLGQKLAEMFVRWFGLNAGAALSAMLPGILQAFSGDLMAGLANMSNQIADWAIKNRESLSGIGKGVGVAAAGVGAYFTGFNVGQSTGSKAKGMAAGAAQGALVGTMIMPGIGTAVAALAGLIGGYLGARKAAEKARKAFLESAGGLDKVREMAEYADFNLNTLLTSKKKNVVEAEIKKLEEAIKKTQERVAKLLTDLTALGSSGGVMSAEFFKRLAKDADKDEVKKAVKDYLSQQTDRGLAAIDRMLKSNAPLTSGALKGMAGAAASFYQQLLELGVPMTEALGKVGEIVDALSAKLSAAGLSGGAAFDQLREMAALAKDQIAGPLLQSISDTTELLVSLANTGWISPQTFTDLASQIGASWAKLEQEGKNTDAAFAAIVPDLQKLWEMQKRFGYAVDETTQRMIDQAVANGQVGEQFMSAQDRSAAALEKLLGRFDLLLQAMGVQVPAAMDTMVGAITDGIDRIPSGIPIRLELTGADELLRNVPADLPAYASGGIAWSPQVARVAEKEPEAIIPLSKLGAIAEGIEQIGGRLTGSVGRNFDSIEQLVARFQSYVERVTQSTADKMISVGEKLLRSDGKPGSPTEIDGEIIGASLQDALKRLDHWSTGSQGGEVKQVALTVQLQGGVGLTEDQLRSLEEQGTRIGKAIAASAWRNESGLRLELQHALGVA